jgi:hypothetical protein
VSASEIQEVVNGLSGQTDKLFSDGLHVGGERFVLTKAEDRSLYARKVSTAFQLDLRPDFQKCYISFTPSSTP